MMADSYFAELCEYEAIIGDKALRGEISEEKYERLARKILEWGRRYNEMREAESDGFI